MTKINTLILSSFIFLNMLNAQEFDRTVLPISPPQDQKFTELDARDAKQPDLFEISAPKDAPNVVIIMLDDVGYSHPSTFGGPVNTPAADKLASTGLKYSRFTVNPICSPSRAALMTGRNAHTAHIGVVAEVATSFPGYDGKRPKSVALLAEMLQLNGYSTAYIGKNHETPTWTVSNVGPFDYWPTQTGFDKFYGFIGDEQNQWYPTVFDGTTPADIDLNDPNYHIEEDFSREAVEWIRSQKSLAPDKPFFLYFSTGTNHAPMQVPQEYIDKYKGKFADGWDVLREKTLANQKSLGLVPDNTVLAEKDKYIVDWDNLTDDEKIVHQREMEVAAGFIEHADVQALKVINAIEELGEYDNTLIIYIMGDNGASAEGTISGLVNVNKYYNNVLDTTSKYVNDIDKFGGRDFYGLYSSAWAVAGCTPFKWTKQMASGGGTRSATVIHYPKMIKTNGEVRHQYHHLIDIAPTVLDVAGIPEPKVVNGVEQIPFQGNSMVYSFNEADAKSTHTTQYYEAFGNRAIYHNGWFAQVIHKAPWEQKPRCSLKDDVWELYNIEEDFSMSNNLAESNPEKLKEMQKIFDAEAEKNNVYPLDDRVVERINPKIAGRPDLMFGRTELTLYEGTSNLFENVFLNTKNTSFDIESEIEVSSKKSNGVIMAIGGQFGGYSLYMKDGYLNFSYNYLGDVEYKTTSKKVVSKGKHKIKSEFVYDGDGLGKGGVLNLYVDGKKMASGRVEQTMPFVYSTSEGASVGWDDSSNVSEDYGIGKKNKFDGSIDYVKVSLKD